ncbi:MAG: prohibitin family protein [Roseiflexaceae bacterium]|nr:prohibitin family protein [Roseiflexaceae bacterium]
MSTGRSVSGARVGTLVVVLVIAVALLGLVSAAWRNVKPGYVGIVFDKASHSVTAGALEPGWAFINPFTQAIQEYPVTIQNYSMVLKGTEGVTAGDDSIKIQSNEGQQLNLDVVIQYQVVRQESGALYQDWGGADISLVEDRVVRQYTRSTVPVIASKYTWEQITSSKRADIVNEISSGLKIEFARRHLDLVSFGIREVHLPESLQKALDVKITAQQAAEQQKYQLEQAKIKAEQDVAEATGRANALKAQAEGEAQATLTRAKAQAEANKELSQSLTPELIRYQQLQRWDGKLPVFNGGNATPFIDVTGIISDTATR